MIMLKQQQTATTMKIMIGLVVMRSREYAGVEDVSTFLIFHNTTDFVSETTSSIRIRMTWRFAGIFTLSSSTCNNISCVGCWLSWQSVTQSLLPSTISRISSLPHPHLTLPHVEAVHFSSVCIITDYIRLIY